MRERNPLDNFLYKTGQHEELSEAEDRLFTPGFKKKFVDPYDEDRPELEYFKGITQVIGGITKVFKPEKIERDIAYVKKRKAGFEQQTTSERSRLAERLTYYLISNKKLLGEGIEALPSSELDDIAHGVDLILETENTDLLPRVKGTPEDRRYWLGVDVTVSEDKWKLRDKHNTVDANIRGGRLTTLSYFEAEDFRGETKVPTIVLEIKQEDLRQMAILLTAKNFDNALFQKIREKIRQDLRYALEDAIETASENISQLQNADEEKRNGHRRMLKVYRAFQEALSRSAQTPEMLAHR
jgi:hypothetical protein